MVNNRIAIGAVQFGLSYGIANINGKKVSRKEIENILNYSQSIGIDTIDTAISYGESEQRLGEIGVNEWQVVTKLPELPNPCHNVCSWVEEQVEKSLSRLRVSRVYGLLLHNPKQLAGPKGDDLWLALQSLKKKKIVNKIGYSVYNPEDLDMLFTSFPPDIVQAPYNILDRRLALSGWLDRMFEAGTEVHIRSVFLQGLLLMKSDERPKKFERWPNIWKAWDFWLHEHKLTAVQASLAFAMMDSRVGKVIIGVDNLSQLKEIMSVVNTKIMEYPHSLYTNDLELIDPSRWNL